MDFKNKIEEGKTKTVSLSPSNARVDNLAQKRRDKLEALRLKTLRDQTEKYNYIMKYPGITSRPQNHRKHAGFTGINYTNSKVKVAPNQIAALDALNSELAKVDGTIAIQFPKQHSPTFASIANKSKVRDKIRMINEKLNSQTKLNEPKLSLNIEKNEMAEIEKELSKTKEINKMPERREIIRPSHDTGSLIYPNFQYQIKSDPRFTTMYKSLHSEEQFMLKRNEKSPDKTLFPNIAKAAHEKEQLSLVHKSNKINLQRLIKGRKLRNQQKILHMGDLKAYKTVDERPKLKIKLKNDNRELIMNNSGRYHSVKPKMNGKKEGISRNDEKFMKTFDDRSFSVSSTTKVGYILGQNHKSVKISSYDQDWDVWGGQLVRNSDKNFNLKRSRERDWQAAYFNLGQTKRLPR